VLAIHILLDVFQSPWPCKIAWVAYTFFFTISLNNLLLISIEQYCGIYHITCIPSSKAIIITILGVWVEAMLASLLMFLFVNVSTVDVNDEYYTIVCRYDLTSPRISLVYTIFSLLVYVIPIILCMYFPAVISKSILNRNSSFRYTVEWKRMFKTSKVVVDIIAGLLVPYLALVLYGFILLTSQTQLSFTVDYFFRFYSIVLPFVKSSLNPVALYLRSSLFRLTIRRAFMKNQVHTSDTSNNSLTITTNNLRPSQSHSLLLLSVTKQNTEELSTNLPHSVLKKNLAEQ